MHAQESSGVFSPGNSLSDSSLHDRARSNLELMPEMQRLAPHKPTHPVSYFNMILQYQTKSGFYSKVTYPQRSILIGQLAGIQCIPGMHIDYEPPSCNIAHPHPTYAHVFSFFLEDELI